MAREVKFATKSSLVVVLSTFAVTNFLVLMTLPIITQAQQTTLDDWPMLGGNAQHTGLSFLKGRMAMPKELWRYEGPESAGGGDTAHIVNGPAVRDVTNDGANEIVVAFGRFVQVLNAENKQKIWEFGTLNDIVSTPGIGDINGDGNREVVVASTDGFIYALNGLNGSLLWNHETKKTNVVISPTLADLNNDGTAEVLVGRSSDLGGITALDGRTGQVMWTSVYSDFTSVAVDDVTGDEKSEVVVASWSIHLLNGTNGNIIWTYQRTPQATAYMPVIADVTGDGKKEIIVGFTDNYIEVLHASNGTVLWKKTLGGLPYGYPIGDINKDGRHDIVALGQQGIIFAFDGFNGATLWTKDVGSGVGYLTAVIVDINGDGSLDFVLGKTSGPLYALNGTNGVELWRYSENVYSRVVIANVMGDDTAEIILGSRSLVVLGWTTSTPSLSVAIPFVTQSDQTFTMTTQAYYAGNPVSDAHIILSSDKGGTFSPEGGYTNSSGHFTFTFMPPTVTAQTTLTITVKATKTGYIDGQSQTQITLNPSQPLTPPPPPQQPDLTLWIYIAAIIIILTSIGGGVTVARRRGKPKQEPTTSSQYWLKQKNRV